MGSSLVDNLKTDSVERIALVRAELRTRLMKSLPEEARERICIFATGSLARLEASKFSDLDAFFYVMGDRKSRLEPVQEICTFHNVIETTRTANFPDFSGGGEYLEFQFLDEVIDNIGSREDDYINGLTSRMLLMLESTPLFNERQFVVAREKVIKRYFIDFHDHSTDFRPIFILNDVLRFWRTLCLNYENKREWRSKDPTERAKGHLKNLKLRFSRLMICYSFVVALLREGPALNANQVIEIASQTPLDRIRGLRDLDEAASDLVDEVLLEYEWFLRAMNHKKEKVLGWIADEDTRNDAFDRSRKFIMSMYKLTLNIAERHDYTRYLVI